LADGNGRLLAQSPVRTTLEWPKRSGRQRSCPGKGVLYGTSRRPSSESAQVPHGSQPGHFAHRRNSGCGLPYAGKEGSAGSAGIPKRFRVPGGECRKLSDGNTTRSAFGIARNCASKCRQAERARHAAQWCTSTRAEMRNFSSAAEVWGGRKFRAGGVCSTVAERKSPV